MLIGKIRERVGLLVGTIAVAMVLFLLMDALDSRTGFLGANNSTGLGSINGEDILPQVYENKINQIITNYESNGMEVTEEMRLQAREQAWKQYVEEMVAKEQYDKLGVTVSDAELKAMLYSGNDDILHSAVKSAAIFLNDSGKFDRSKLEQYVASFSTDNPQAQQSKAQWKRFEDNIYDQTLRGKYTTLIKKAMYIPTWYAKMDNADKNAKAAINYVMVPYTSVDDASIQVSDNELLSYLNAHKNEFKQKESRQIDYVSFPVVPTKEDSTVALNAVASKIEELKSTDNVERFIKIQDSEIPYTGEYFTKDELVASAGSMRDTLFRLALGTTVGPYYESGSYRAFRIIDRKNLADSMQVSLIFKAFGQTGAADKAKKSIDSIKTLINNGASFAAVADSATDDPSTKGKGGDMGYMKRNDQRLPKEILNDIFYNHKVGDMFVTETGGGAFLIKVTKAGGSKEAAKVAFLTKNVEPSENTINAIYGKAQQFAGANHTLEAFKTAAEAQQLGLKSSNDIEKGTFRIEGLGIADEIITWAFQNPANTVSDRVFSIDNKLPDGRINTNYVVAAVAKAKEEGIATLADAKERLSAAVKKQKKAEQIAAKIGAVTSLEQVASANAQEVQNAADISFGAPSAGSMGREPQVQAAIFGLQNGQISKPITGERGVYVVQLSALTPAPEVADIATAKTQLLEPLQGRVDFGVMQAISKLADVQDNRLKVRQ
jgi:peptidyl-prolyl cis-trans isomerase D